MISAPRKTRRAPCVLRAVCLPLLLLVGLHEAGFPSPARALDSREETSALDSDTQAAPLSLDLQKQMDLIRARILSRRGLFPESLSLYQELRTRFPEDREIRLDFIETLVNEGATDAAEQELGAYLMDNFYCDFRIKRMMKKGEQVIERLFSLFSQDSQLLPPAVRQEIADMPAEKTRIVADYIASLSDREAMQEYHAILP